MTVPLRDFRSRRAWLSGAAGLLTAGLVAPRTRADPGPEAGGKPKILVAGDSMIAGGLGIYLERDLRELYGYPVLRRGKTSSGLSRPDFFDWMEEAQRLVDEFQPEATLVMFGGNDVQGLYMGKGEWIRFPEEEAWREEYARRVEAFCQIVAPSGQHIFWIGMPVMRPEKFHEKIRRVNTIYRAEMAIRPGAHFIDIWDLLSDGAGGYADKVATSPAQDGEKPKLVRVRAGDGIHLSPAGARFVADHVKAIVHGVLSGTASEPTLAGAQ